VLGLVGSEEVIDGFRPPVVLGFQPHASFTHALMLLARPSVIGCWAAEPGIHARAWEMGQSQILMFLNVLPLSALQTAPQLRQVAGLAVPGAMSASPTTASQSPATERWGRPSPGWHTPPRCLLLQNVNCQLQAVISTP